MSGAADITVSGPSHSSLGDGHRAPRHLRLEMVKIGLDTRWFLSERLGSLHFDELQSAELQPVPCGIMKRACDAQLDHGSAWASQVQR